MGVRIPLVVPICSCSTKVVHYIGNVETVDRYHPGAPNSVDSIDKYCYTNSIETNLGNNMARITSQAAVEAVGNRYDLVLIAALRARELKRGHRPMVSKVTGPNVTALREIEEGKVGRDYLLKLAKKK
jgi:DNA-directed RNA polymerase subunit omega